MQDVVISGSGVFTPVDAISNQELVDSFNKYVAEFNANHPEDQHLQESSAEFILKASGIKSRYVMDKAGILNTTTMRPQNLERDPEQVSLHCEIAVKAAKQAMEQAQVCSADIGTVLVACSDVPRPYPALAIEVQEQLGIDGYAYDLNVACASAAFGIQNGYHTLANSKAKTKAVLMVNPEICTGQLNFRDRDSHFIFGDACSAVIMQQRQAAISNNCFQILSTKLITKFSNNIRNSFGYLNCTNPDLIKAEQKLFKQEGRKVFKEVVPMVAEHLATHLQECNIDPTTIKRFWLHQANLNMNELIAKKILGRTPDRTEAPIILDQYANTSSAGSVIAFHLHNAGISAGDNVILAAFGAGYSCGSIIMQKL